MHGTEAESKEKYGVWDPMPELTIISLYVDARVDSDTFTMGIGQPYARVDLDPMPESTLSPSQGTWPLGSLQNTQYTVAVGKYSK